MQLTALAAFCPDEGRSNTGFPVFSPLASTFLRGPPLIPLSFLAGQRLFVFFSKSARKRFLSSSLRWLDASLSSGVSSHYFFVKTFVLTRGIFSGFLWPAALGQFFPPLFFHHSSSVVFLGVCGRGRSCGVERPDCQKRFLLSLCFFLFTDWSLPYSFLPAQLVFFTDTEPHPPEACLSRLFLHPLRL